VSQIPTKSYKILLDSDGALIRYDKIPLLHRSFCVCGVTATSSFWKFYNPLVTDASWAMRLCETNAVTHNACFHKYFSVECLSFTTNFGTLNRKWWPIRNFFILRFCFRTFSNTKDILFRTITDLNHGMELFDYPVPRESIGVDSLFFSTTLQLATISFQKNSIVEPVPFLSEGRSQA